MSIAHDTRPLCLQGRVCETICRWQPGVLWAETCCKSIIFQFRVNHLDSTLIRGNKPQGIFPIKVHHNRDNYGRAKHSIVHQHSQTHALFIFYAPAQTGYSSSLATPFIGCSLSTSFLFCITQSRSRSITSYRVNCYLCGKIKPRPLPGRYCEVTWVAFGWFYGEVLVPNRLQSVQ